LAAGNQCSQAPVASTCQPSPITGFYQCLPTTAPLLAGSLDTICNPQITGQCDPGLICDYQISTSRGLCRAPLAEGQQCFLSSQCQTGLLCVPPYDQGLQNIAPVNNTLICRIPEAGSVGFSCTVDPYGAPSFATLGSDCGPSNYCAATSLSSTTGQCSPTLADGQLCNYSYQCNSGYCNQGVCQDQTAYYLYYYLLEILYAWYGQGGQSSSFQ